MLGFEGLPQEVPLIKALRRSDDLTAFTVAEIGAPFSESDMKNPRLDMFTQRFKDIDAMGMGSKFTALTSGDYVDYALGWICSSHFYWH